MKYSISDWHSKLDKKADMRTTVITAAERFQMLEKKMHGSHAYDQAAEEGSNSTESLDDEQKQNRIRELVAKKKKSNMLVVPGSHNPPIAGVLSGHEWNKFIKEVWGKEDNVVVHSVIMPPGKDPRQITFTRARIRSSKIRTSDEDASLQKAYPATATGPADVFEAFVESDCIPPQRFVPNHFLVANTRDMEIKQIDLNIDSEEKPKELDVESVWHQEAIQYSSRRNTAEAKTGAEAKNTA